MFLILNEFSSYCKRNLKDISYFKDISSHRYFFFSLSAQRNSYFFKTDGGDCKNNEGDCRNNSTEMIGRTAHGVTN